MPATAMWTTNKIGLTGCTAGPALLVTRQGTRCALKLCAINSGAGPAMIDWASG